MEEKGSTKRFWMFYVHKRAVESGGGTLEGAGRLGLHAVGAAGHQPALQGMERAGRRAAGDGGRRSGTRGGGFCGRTQPEKANGRLQLATNRTGQGEMVLITGCQRLDATQRTPGRQGAGELRETKARCFPVPTAAGRTESTVLLWAETELIFFLAAGVLGLE